MKRRIKILTVALVLMAMLVPSAAFAAASSVSISGGGSVAVGKTITVTVTYKGSALGYVNGQLTYDNRKLEYISGGSSQGDAGLVSLKTHAGDTSGKISFKVKFKGVGAGNVNLALETLETRNLDEDQSLGTPSSNKTVNVTAADTATTKPTEESNTNETTEAAIAPTEAAEATDQQQNDSEQGFGVSYPLLIGIAAVIILLIVVIVRKLRGKKRKYVGLKGGQLK